MKSGPGKGWVLVCSSCYYKTTITWMASNNRHLFLTALEPGDPKSRCQYDWVLGEDSLPGL